MAETITKSDMAKLYTRLTGLTQDIDEAIAACESDEEKAELFAKTMWLLKRGQVLPEDGKLAGEYAMGFKTLVPWLQAQLGVATSGDIDMDGDSDEDDKRLADDIELASTIEIEAPDDSDERNMPDGLDID